MPGQFYKVGKIQLSNTRRSFKVFLLDSKSKWVFVGLVTPRALTMLLRREVQQADISKFSQTTQTPLDGFSLRLEELST